MLVPIALGWKHAPLRWPALLAALALAGCGRALLTHLPDTAASLAYYKSAANGPKVTVIGVVVEEPLRADRWQRLRVRAEAVRLPNERTPRSVSGDMLALVSRYPEYSAGDRLSLQGELTPPPEISGFDYEAYLAAHGVYSYMYFPGVKALGSRPQDSVRHAFQAARANVSASLRRSVPEPEASLAVGVVVGDRSSMPKPIQEAFRVTGTTHVLAISGQNIALMVGFVWFLMQSKQRTRRPTLLLTAALVICIGAYTIFTGATPSVIRAAVMSCVVLFAPLVGRRYDPLAALAISSFGMTALDPQVLLDTGFQLSFGAMLGIILAGPRIHAGLSRARCPELLSFALATGLAAQVFTLPIWASLNASIPLVGLPATMTVDLALLPLMLTGIVTGLLGMVAPPLAALTGLLVWPCAAWMIAWVNLWASLPWASLGVEEASPIWAVSYYALVGGLLWLLDPRQRKGLVEVWSRDKSLVALGLVAASVWIMAVWLVFAR
jgi:competence protein ComEC